VHFFRTLHCPTPLALQFGNNNVPRVSSQPHLQPPTCRVTKFISSRPYHLTSLSWMTLPGSHPPASTILRVSGVHKPPNHYMPLVLKQLHGQLCPFCFVILYSYSPWATISRGSGRFKRPAECCLLGCDAIWRRTEVSEEYIVSIIRVERIRELRTLVVTSN
jgi:hypothetical protein